MPATFSDIPVIDLAPLRDGGAAGLAEVAAAVGRACRDTGFFVAAGTPVSGETMTDKPGMSMFWNTHLVFAGGTKEVCVRTSVREVNERGPEGLPVTDAAERYFPAFKEAAIARRAAQGAIVGWATPLAALEEALQ